MSLRSMAIGMRLGIGFAILLALLAVVVVGGNVMSDIAMRRLTSGQAAANAKGALAETMKSALLEAAVATRNIGLQSEVKAMSQEEDRVREQRKRYAEARDRLVATGLESGEKELLDGLARVDKEIEEPFAQAIGQSLNFNPEVAAKIITGKIDPLTRQSIEQINRLVGIEQAAASRFLEENAEAEARRHVLSYGIGALAVALGLLLAWVITRSITRPLKDAVDIASRVAAGDLSSEVEARGGDETALLMRALRDMNGGLRQIVTEVRGGTERISAASREISRGNADLSSRTEEQASSLEETASSMEELTSAVQQNADNAKRANEFALGASQVAEAGGKAMDDVIAMMGGISDSSRKIAEIIGVIDAIAFQTNILALNAAVEAARAGDQGRGFAVVASEVRNLAQRSADAAKEIKGLIQKSAERVDGGARLVEGAGKTMGEIVLAVKRVTGIMSDIASASQEQLTGIQQVGRAVTEMDRVTQQNAALVEESAAASEHMSAQAQQLVGLVERFKVDDGATPAQARSAHQPEIAGRPAPRLPDRPSADSRLAAPPERVRKEAVALAAAAIAGAKGSADGEWEEF
ncbi:MAG TPA: methyl-accepting chemotaxis protein [Usitatibacter sp.]|nr:methyl-accepting chemotaxis protein [Usitatibacter sp.]